MAKTEIMKTFLTTLICGIKRRYGTSKFRRFLDMHTNNNNIVLLVL